MYDYKREVAGSEFGRVYLAGQNAIAGMDSETMDRFWAPLVARMVQVANTIENTWHDVRAERRTIASEMQRLAGVATGEPFNPRDNMLWLSASTSKLMVDVARHDQAMAEYTTLFNLGVRLGAWGDVTQ